MKKIKAYLIDLSLWSYAILVCYKIIWIKLIQAVRYPQFTWSQPLTAVLVGMVITTILFNIKGFSIGKKGLSLLPPAEGDEEASALSRPYNIFILFQLFLTFLAGIFISQVSLKEFFSSAGMMGAQRIFAALVNPNFNIFEPVLFAAIETIYMAFIATAFAIPFAFIISFFAARNLMQQSRLFFSIYFLARLMLNLTRSIEPLVWAIIFSVWVGIGPFAGMIALMLHSVASLSKLYSEQIENIDNGPLEAMTATGAHPLQIVWYGVVPQIIIPFLSFTIYRWDINVRMATIIGLVGGGGIGTMLMQYQGLAKWNEVGLIVMMIAAIVWLMDYASAKIRENIR